MTTQDARSEIARQIENDFDVFYLSGSDLEDFQTYGSIDGDCGRGWYFWPCQDGYLPDGDGVPEGPYHSEKKAKQEIEDRFYDDFASEPVANVSLKLGSDLISIPLSEIDGDPDENRAWFGELDSVDARR